eukprot:gene6810-7915_t
MLAILYYLLGGLSCAIGMLALIQLLRALRFPKNYAKKIFTAVIVLSMFSRGIYLILTPLMINGPLQAFPLNAFFFWSRQVNFFKSKVAVVLLTFFMTGCVITIASFFFFANTDSECKKVDQGTTFFIVSLNFITAALFGIYGLKIYRLIDEYKIVLKRHPEKITKMQYVNGHDISSQNIAEVHTLALSPKIPWTPLAEESDELSIISAYTSKEKGIYLNKGVSEFNISPENMYELLCNVSLRKKWDLYCTEANILEEYDYLNHIVSMSITHPLGVINMNLYRSCKYDPQARLYIIAMRSIELEDEDQGQTEHENFECLPNGWLIQGIDGYANRCRLTFVQQCHLRDIEIQKIPGHKSFQTNQSLGNFHYLTIFPASVSGRLGKIFQCIRSYITVNVKEIEIKDTRLKILEQAEREVNEMFGTSTVDYGWSTYLKKYDMEILVKKVNDTYFMVGKGSFSSMYTPSQIGDLLYCDQPWGWDTFYEKGVVVEDIAEHSREVELFYRMWHESFSMRVLQSIKKGPGNCSAVHWRSISTNEVVNQNDMELSYLPSGIFNYGLGVGSFTSFLVALEVKGAKTPAEEQLVTKLFAARIISTQNHIINVMNIQTKAPQADSYLPVIPTLDYHCQSTGVELNGGQRGAPIDFYNMVETFANLLLADSISVNQKRAHRTTDDSSKSKRKRDRDGADEEDEDFIDESDDSCREITPFNDRPTIRTTTNIISNKLPCNDGMYPKSWNTSKKQPFLFLVSEKNQKTKLRRRDVSFTNSSFDQLPEELVQIIFSSLKAPDILSASMVCKRFKMATDSSSLWKLLYLANPVFHKSVPKRYRPPQVEADVSALGGAPAMLEQFITMISKMSADAANDGTKGVTEKGCGCSAACICKCMDSCNCECLNEELIGVSNWRSQYLHKVKLADRWAAASPKKVIELRGHSKTVKALKAEGSSAVSVSTDKKVRFWNLNSGQFIGTYEEPSTTVVTIDYDRSAKSSFIWPLSEYTKVHIGHKNGTVALVDFMEQPPHVVSTQRPVLLADGFDFSMAGKYIIWESCAVECWEQEKKARLWMASEHTKKINQAKSINSSLFAHGIVATASSDKSIKIRNIMDGAVIASLGGYMGAVNCVESVGDYMIVSGSSDKLVKLWDLRQLSHPIITNSGHSSAVRCITYEEKGGRILSGGDDGVVVIWNLENWNGGRRRECLGVPNTNDHKHQLDPSAPQKPLTIGTCMETGRLNRHTTGVTCIDSDEAGFISGSSDGIIYRWDFA